MFSGFQKIVEERILRAQKNGEFDNLTGFGEPLDLIDDYHVLEELRQNGEFDNLTGSGEPLDLIDDYHVSEELRLAHKILKNAECLPPEIELTKEIKHTEELLGGMEETHEKYLIIKKLNYLIMKLNASRPQLYTEKLVDHLGSSRSNK